MCDSTRRAPLQRLFEVIEVTGIRGDNRGWNHSSVLTTTRDQLESVVDEIRLAEMVGIDFETTGLNPRADRIRLISLSRPPRVAGSSTASRWTHTRSLRFSPIRSSLCTTAHSIFGSFPQWASRLEEGAEVLDTMLISQILEDKEIHMNPNNNKKKKVSHKLEDVVRRELGVQAR